jgi:hypothetical protein
MTTQVGLSPMPAAKMGWVRAPGGKAHGIGPWPPRISGGSVLSALG